MKNTEFDPPVSVLVDPAGGQMIIHNTSECTDFLLKQWRGKRGDKHRAAVQACADAGAHLRPTANARRAFVAAVREAGTLVNT
ncbi:DUF982 domain-containing protein [Mesorhizobium sp. CN2-181]|uniref:DUF982 domain-containing protein n=1 Tax=Mesorhizobium yinganensis TaxID=3157707 RepID=UPI0032B877FD